MNPENKPFVTLSYAQSLDGCIGKRGGARVSLSGPEALAMTHSLRAQNDAILVGIGTILADDPLLTVRFAEGTSPQPIILDSRLQLPDNARILARTDRKPILFCDYSAGEKRKNKLKSLGCRIIPVSEGKNSRLDLRIILDNLSSLGIKTLMVEGGSRVIASFLSENLVDKIILTISPLFLGGINPPAPPTRASLADRGQLEVERLPISVQDQVHHELLRADLHGERDAPRLIAPVRLVQPGAVPGFLRRLNEPV